jgi:succinate dehydrogenase hydrophobic anchor subunit
LQLKPFLFNILKQKPKKMENTPQPHQETTESPSSFNDDIKTFYKGDLKNLLTTIFTNPIDGTFSIFKTPSKNSFNQSLIIFGSLFLTYLVSIYLIVGEYRKYMDMSDFLKPSAVPVMMVLVISVITFVIKAMSGNANFKEELLTGAMCAIPLAVFALALVAFKIFAGENVLNNIKNPFDLGVFFSLIMLYLFLHLINVVQQSLKSAGTKDVLAFYLSPATVMISVYLTYKIAEGLFS